MREGLDQWPFVIAAYAAGLIPLVILLIWAVLDMRRAERRREQAKRK